VRTHINLHRGRSLDELPRRYARRRFEPPPELTDDGEAEYLLWQLFGGDCHDGAGIDELRAAWVSRAWASFTFGSLGDRATWPIADGSALPEAAIPGDSREPAVAPRVATERLAACRSPE
jgi:hypothetical protein